MANVEPKLHSTMSRTTTTIGQGSSTGFRWGLLGAVAAFFTLPLIGAGLAAGIAGVAGLEVAAAGVAALAAGGITLIVQAVSLPGALAVGTVAGGALGFFKGAQKGGQQISAEEFAARKQLAYHQTANAIVAQQFAQPQPVMSPLMDSSEIQKAMQAPIANENERPSTRIEQASVELGERVQAPAKAAGLEV